MSILNKDKPLRDKVYSRILKIWKDIIYLPVDDNVIVHFNRPEMLTILYALDFDAACKDTDEFLAKLNKKIDLKEVRHLQPGDKFKLADIILKVVQPVKPVMGFRHLTIVPIGMVNGEAETIILSSYKKVELI